MHTHPPEISFIIANRQKLKRYPVLVLLSLIWLQGCTGMFILPASNIITQTSLDDEHQAHDQAFRQQHHYAVHRVPRSEYSLHAIEFGRAFKGKKPVWC